MSVFLEKGLLIVPMQSQNMGACTMPLQSALVFCSNFNLLVHDTVP